MAAADAADAAGRVRLATQADRDGLDLFTVADHPYFGDKLDAYALTGFLLGQTERITGMVAVTNLPSRPAPVLARTLTYDASLSYESLSPGNHTLRIGGLAPQCSVQADSITRTVKAGGWRPWAAEACDKNRSINLGISDHRSRSGGIVIGKTLRR